MNNNIVSKSQYDFMMDRSFQRKILDEMNEWVENKMFNIDKCKNNVLDSDNEDFPMYVLFSLPQINTLLEQDVDGVQRKIEEFFNFKDLQTNLKEAILVDYYVDGFCWGKEMNFTSQQLAGLMGLLHVLMENIATKQMTLEENLKELGRALTGIGQSHPDKKGGLTFFNTEQAKEIINYLRISIFQHYKLYEYMFNYPRDVMVLGAEQVIEVVKPAETPFPAPLEEGVSSEIYAQFLAPSHESSQNTEPEKTEVRKCIYCSFNNFLIVHQKETLVIPEEQVILMPTKMK
ncbi:ciliary-associated calcium-binding coiled-coil protein 1 [Rhinophrynus dorsalis]